MRDSSNVDKQVIRLVLLLAVLAGTLLILTSFSGIFLSRKLQSHLTTLDRSAIAPSLVFHEVRDYLGRITVRLLEIEMDSSSEHRRKMSLAVQDDLSGLSKILSRHQSSAKGEPYEEYLREWVKDWTLLSARIGDRLRHAPPSKLALSYGRSVEELGALDTRIDNINAYIRADVADKIDSAQSLSDRSTALLGLIMFLGLATTSVVTMILLSELKDIFRRQDESKRLIEEQRVTIVASAKMSSLGEMAGGVAHEINNPLAVITILSAQIRELLDSDPLDKPTIKEMIAGVDKVADRIARIVQGLRTFSRDSSKDPFQKCNVHDVIIDTLSFCSEKFALAGVPLNVETFNKSLCFFGRPTEISQVIVNLLSNSFDAISGLDEKWVRIAAFDKDDRIEIRITDSGRGIPGELREKIFQPFFTTKEIGKGTGMGLSISMGIMKSHEGSLTIDGQCQNTCFVLQLPKV